MPQRVDFSGNAPVYDRRHGAILPAELTRRLVRAADLHAGTCVLDIGAGTGRVAVALGSLGCNVIAVEPAQPMLEALKQKASGLPVRAVVAEGAHLPFRRASADAVVLARVLYLMTDWREVLEEVASVVKLRGCLVHEWGNGAPDEEWVQIRDRARTIFEEAGVQNPFHPGARSEEEIDAVIQSLGFSLADTVRVDGDIRCSLGEFLRRIDDGECSYTWEVPVELRPGCLAELRKWTANQFGLDHVVTAPREIQWKIFRRN